MTGRDGTPEETGVSPETERQVRALLAESAGTAPTPPDVAARLDDALAGLVAERERPHADGAVVGATELGSRRARSWPRLLVAAAAVSVLGLGIGNLDDLTGAGAGDAASTESAAGGAAEERVQADPYPSLATAPRLSTSSATLDVQRIEDFALAVPVGDAPEAWARMCVQPAAGPGDEWLPVRLDGEPGVLVLRAPVGGRRTAEIFTCEDAESPALSTEVLAAR